MSREEAQPRILQIRSHKMNVSPDVNPKELAHYAEDFSRARCEVECEGSRDRAAQAPDELTQEDSTEGVLEVPAKKKANPQNYTCSLVWRWLES